MWSLVFGKYKEIVISILLFVILDASILLFSYYTSFQIANDTHAVQLASRQSMLTQRVFQKVYQYKSDLSIGRNVEQVSADITIPFNQFNEVLDAFIYGGELIGVGQGRDKLLNGSMYTDLANTHLKPAEKFWLPYKSMIAPLVYADYEDDPDIERLSSRAEGAIAYAKANGDQLLNSVQDFAVAVEEKAKNRTKNLRLVQAIGITLAVINFFIILFHFLKKLSHSDSVAAQAQAEKTGILNTVKDGLFLINNDRSIGSQFSGSMKKLFKRDDFSGDSYVNLLRPLVDEKTLGNAQDFVDVLFKKRVKVHLMAELNPLRQVQININDSHGFSTHYFSFDFSRVEAKGKKPSLLVTVTDITEQTELRRKLELSQQQAGTDLELLLSIIHVDRELVDIFMQTLDASINRINKELEYPVSQTNSHALKINNIYRILHGLKGEASALNIQVVEQKLHGMEDILETLNQRDDVFISGDDFLPITIELNKLVNIKESIQKVIQRLPELTDHKDKVGQNSRENFANNMQSQLNGLLKNISEDKGKLARLDMSRFDCNILPIETTDILKNTFIQFVRNAVVHGLETPKEREALGKDAEGTIWIRSESQNDKIILTIRDDGRGINTREIRNKLIAAGKYSAEEVNRLKSSQLVGYLFQPGFTTLDDADEHGGRGIGLDLVKESLGTLGASLSVISKRNESTEFKIRLPIHANYKALAS